MKAKYCITVLSLLLFLSFGAFAQKEMKDVKVPKSISDAFTKLYPKATDLKWEKEGEEEFEAVFKNNGTDISVVLDEDGKVMETETVIPVSELPKPVSLYVEKKYAGYAISEASKTVDAKGTVTFEAQVTKDKIQKELVFDKNGKHMKKEKKIEKDEKEEHEKN